MNDFTIPADCESMTDRELVDFGADAIYRAMMTLLHSHYDDRAGEVYGELTRREKPALYGLAYVKAGRRAGQMTSWFTPQNLDDEREGTRLLRTASGTS